MRKFETGATRDQDENKFDFEGFISPIVIERFGAYMHKHRQQADGQLRDSSNWAKGIPISAYMKSLYRHFHSLCLRYRGWSEDDAEEQLCAIIFNAQGMLHELIRKRYAPETEGSDFGPYRGL